MSRGRTEPIDQDAVHQIFLRWVTTEGREPRCPNCTYLLTGLKEPVCPECGSPLTLRVRPLDARHRAFLAGLVATACGLGFSGLFVLLMTVHSLSQSRPATSERGFALNAIMATVFLSLMVPWIAFRRKLRNLPRQVQNAAAFVLSVFTLGFFVVFGWVFGLQ